MKKIFFLAGMFLATLCGFAQSEKYTKAMEQLVPAVDTTRNADALTNIANSFQRIADAEKTQWLPYYYAALTNTNAGYMLSMTPNAASGIEKIDAIADKAEALLNKAEELSKNNSEIFVVKKMIATLRLMVDPQNRYMTYGPVAAEALGTAKKLNPENPRVYLLEGQDKFYTPEQFGGSKTEAKKLFDEALKKFGSFKTESSIHPSWGLNQVNYFISQAQ